MVKMASREPDHGSQRTAVVKRTRKDSTYILGYDKQFTLLEAIYIPYVILSYVATWSIIISILVEKYHATEPPPNEWLYIFFVILPHVLAGLKNLHFHYFEVDNGKDGPNMIVNVLFLPVSPLIRYVRSWKYGRNEGDNWESKMRFVNERVTAEVLLLVENFLGVAPIVILLLRDDIWNRSSDWQLLITGSTPDITCFAYCEEVLVPNMGWITFRLVFLISQIAQNLTSYNVMVKRYQRLENPEFFHHLPPSARGGKINILGRIIMFSAHLFFIGSRLMGFSMVIAQIQFFAFLIVSFRWVVNIVWHLLTTLKATPNFATRSLSSFFMGGVWMLGLTNEQGGHQLGRYLMYYFLSFVETCICCTLWLVSVRGSGDIFTLSGIWAVVIAFIISGILHSVYYSMCHPSNPSISRRGLLCCTRNRRDLIEEDERTYYKEGYSVSYSRRSTQSTV